MASRGALLFLQDYGSDTDDESKRELDDASPSFPSKRPCISPVADMAVCDDDADELALSESRTVQSQDVLMRTVPFPEEFSTENSSGCEDPHLHEGRIRSFPHERGNWASFFYIPCVNEPYYDSMLKSLVTCCGANHVTLVPSKELHISLSRTLVLSFHWIQPILKEVKKKVEPLSRFTLWLHGLSVYLNDEKTRTFLGLKVRHGKSDLDRIISEIDSTLVGYKLPTYYKESSYHMSIGWCLGDVCLPMRQLLPQLENICSQYFAVESEIRVFDVDKLVFKSGNQVHSIGLS